MAGKKAQIPAWMKAMNAPPVYKMPSMVSQQAAMAPGKQSSQVISEIRGVSLLASEGSDEETTKLIVWTGEVNKKTMFAPAVIERMTRANSMKKCAVRLIEAMRCTAQPNRHFRAERLVPGDVNGTSERTEFARSLGDFGSCFDNMEPLLGYNREVVDLETQIDQHHEVFLRQVMIFCVKPLKSFIDSDHPELLRVHGELEKLRDKYDSARKKDQSRALESKRELVARAREFASLLDQLTTHQMVFAKALDSFARAEAGFGGMVSKLSGAVKQPDHKKRWAVPT